MSQRKVDNYKKERARRMDEARRDKIEERLTILLFAIIGVLIIIWAGFGIYQKVTSVNTNKELVTTEVDLGPITDYMNEHSLNNAQ
ncbi:MAG: hypothetical protein ACI4HI_09610 [Lachnospiraceae bacterium]